jgi:hypothetical protein
MIIIEIIALSRQEKINCGYEITYCILFSCIVKIYTIIKSFIMAYLNRYKFCIDPFYTVSMIWILIAYHNAHSSCVNNISIEMWNILYIEMIKSYIGIVFEFLFLIFVINTCYLDNIGFLDSYIKNIELIMAVFSSDKNENINLNITTIV